MGFEKGHEHGGKGGRPKGSKNKQRLIRYSPKEWVRITKHNTYNQEQIIHRLENNLAIDDLIDIMDSKYNRNK